MLTQRKENILKIIVSEYVPTATPVGSETIAYRHRLGLSPATIRNEMARLEEESYITQPHHSAGRIPMDKGYRYYVESLMEDYVVPLANQLTIRHQFHQAEREIEEWAQLAVSILSRLAQNVAIITLPKSMESRFKHLELISLQQFLALLILVLGEAKVKRQMLPLDEAASQDELRAIASKLNSAYAGLTSFQINNKNLELSPIEEKIMKTLVGIMQAEDEHEYEEPYLEGLRHILNQPEFSSASKMLELLEVLEEKNLLRSILPQVLTGAGIRVVIGRENQQDVMRDFSVVLSRYGIPSQIGGAVGVIGPTRMEYSQTISMVRYIAAMMSQLASELYG